MTRISSNTARSDILDAAREVLCRNGFTGTELDDIAKAADEDVAAVRVVYPTVGDVVAALYDQIGEEFAPWWAALDEGFRTRDRDTLASCLEHAVTWWEEHPALHSVIREAAVVDVRIGREIREHFTRQLVNGLPRFLGALPDAERTDAILTVQTLILQLDQVCYDRIVAGAPASERPDVVRVMTDVWMLAPARWSRPGVVQPDA